MDTRLDETLEDLDLSDAAFADECGLLRGQVWAYRRGRKVPGSENAAAVLAALKKHGVEMTVAELIAPRKRKRRERRSKSAAA